MSAISMYLSRAMVLHWLQDPVNLVFQYQVNKCSSYPGPLREPDWGPYLVIRTLVPHSAGCHS